VLAYPLKIASVCRSYLSGGQTGLSGGQTGSLVPDFVVSLPSVLQLLTATLRLTNRLHQLACKGLSPFGINLLSFDNSAHAGHTQAMIMSDWLSPNPPDFADPFHPIRKKIKQ